MLRAQSTRCCFCGLPTMLSFNRMRHGCAHLSDNQRAAEVNKSQCIYTKCYCEENVYWLVHKLAGLPVPASVQALLQQQQCATLKHASAGQASADEAAEQAPPSRAAARATGASASSPSAAATTTSPAAELCSTGCPPADPMADLCCLWVVFISNPAKQVRCLSRTCTPIATWSERSLASGLEIRS